MANLSRYLLAFIIGSSWFPIVRYYLSISLIGTGKQDSRDFSYEEYSIVASLYLGLVNVFGLFLSEYFHIISPYRYFIVGTLSGIFIAIRNYIYRPYHPFTDRQYLYYVIHIIIKHIVTFGFIINMIETYLEQNLCKSIT